MLWLKIKPGNSAYIDGSTLTLLSKNRYGITVYFREENYTIAYGSSRKFTDFTLHVANFGKGLRLGFDAPAHVHIAREV